jgi:opacity protein-like surface antigen
MKRFLVLALVALLVVSVTYAGDSIVPKTKAGNKALLFTLGGLSNLSAGQYGGGIGAKYYFANNWAGRLGIGFNTSTETTKNPQSPTPAGETGERDETSTNFSITPGVLYTIAVSGPVNAYVGGQLLFVMGSTSADGIGGNGFDSDSKLETSTTSIGAGLLLGVEWFPWENVSFGAEYALGFLSGSGETESTVNGTGSTSDSPSTMSIGTSAVNGANLTLSVFF